MAIREILQIGHPTLREKSKKITRFDGALETLVEDMFETMHEANGVGLAAPQIGVPGRLIVIEMPDDPDYDHRGERWIVCNPEIVKASRETEVGQEGCLSVVGYVGMVERATEVVVRGQDLHGGKVRIKAKDYLARVFQHEIDHLDGVLYVDVAEENSIMTVEEYEEQVRQDREQEEQEAAVPVDAGP